VSKPKPTWTRLNERTVYKGRVHIVEYDIELPDGHRSKYEVDHGASFAASVLIKLHSGKIALVYQYRFPPNRWIYELPGGGKKSDETPEQTAIRECKEEIGIEPVTLIQLATFYPNPARTDWPIHVFYCDDYVDGVVTDTDDPSETMERIEIAPKALQKHMDNLEIVDPSLLIAWNTAINRGYITPN
jgi:8-oxo-dGTP pyrophosphatase MutT (NUDIX family)